MCVLYSMPEDSMRILIDMKKNRKDIIAVFYAMVIFLCMTGIIISIVCMFSDFGYGDMKIYVLQIIGCVTLMILTMCVLSPMIDDDKEDKKK